MTHIANKGDHKFDHLVGGYPLDAPPAPLSLDDYGVVPAAPSSGPATDEFFRVPTRLVVWDECSFSRYLREALASADDRTRGLVLPLEILHGTDSELRSRLRSLIRSSHGTATPVVISCATADSAQGLSGSVKANVEARIAADDLR